MFSVQRDETKFEAQFARLLAVVAEEFKNDPERVEKLTKMYTDLKDRFREAPASTRTYFHNAYPGGYLDHVLHVLDCAFEMVKAYKKAGGPIDFTRPELVFAALNHDLGKLGDEDGPYYREETSDWHRQRGQRYRKESDKQFLTQNDTAVYMLNLYGITFTKQEFLGMKLADGMYAEGNEAYLRNNDEFPMRSALPYLIHWADHMACVSEKAAFRVQTLGK